MSDGEQSTDGIAHAIEEKKPGVCGGCGLPKKDGYRRAPHETSFVVRYITANGGLLFVCQQCRTKTHVPLVDTRETVGSLKLK